VFVEGTGFGGNSIASAKVGPGIISKGMPGARSYFEWGNKLQTLNDWFCLTVGFEGLDWGKLGLLTKPNFIIPTKFPPYSLTSYFPVNLSWLPASLLNSRLVINRLFEPRMEINKLTICRLNVINSKGSNQIKLITDYPIFECYNI
jgi:hypothetical protein